MKHLNFSKEQLVFLPYSLEREILHCSSNGAFATTSLTFCNTRKYHGLFIAPQPAFNNDNHLLLSSLDETIEQNEQEWNLALHRYENNSLYPNGHKYLEEFTFSPVQTHIYRVGTILLSKQLLMSKNQNYLIIKYKVLDANFKFLLKLKPLLAFRQVHQLSKANDQINKEVAACKNGINSCLYENYTPLYMQTSMKSAFKENPAWYYNFEYEREMERGYDFLEDLYTPGNFEVELNAGDELYFSVGLKEVTPISISRTFEKEAALCQKIENLEDYLKKAAGDFIVKIGKKTEVIAGFPWFGRWGRDTFISLPGLTLTTGKEADCKAVIDTMLEELDGPLFPNIGQGDHSAYNSVDAPLWFFWALQQYAEHTQTKDKIWKEYGKKMLLILNGFKNGTHFNIHRTPEGLIWAGQDGKALTWMDAMVNGRGVTPRIGMPIEINALWYNAVMFSIEVAKLAKDNAFVEEWEGLIADFPEAFKRVFWSKENGCLADCANNGYKDFSIRPNMVFAASLPYSPLSLKLQQMVVEIVKTELLTPRGLRTLSPKDCNYKGHYFGPQEERDSAYHQGTVWTWLLGHFAEAYLRVYGRSGLSYIEDLYYGFEETLLEAGLGTISEVFDGDPPYLPGGTISQAWSVAEILRMKNLIDLSKQK